MSSENAAPCRHPGAPPDAIVEKVQTVIASLADDAAYLAQKGLSAEEFKRALPAAIEQLRGSKAASNADRRHFLTSLFEEMQARGIIKNFDVPAYGSDTVYRLSVDGLGDIAIIQKGCPDGAHSSLRWSRPDWATEAYLWWLCSSLAYEPGTHIAKGVNRLRSRFFAEDEDAIDGVIFQSELCGTAERPCPKGGKSVVIGNRNVPPPCLYVMPDSKDRSGGFNWDGSRKRGFPTVLLSMFDIRDAAAYTGHIGFQKRGASIRNTIAMPYGTGRSTIYRS